MKTTIILILCAILAYVAWVGISSWRKQTGSLWTRILGTANESATILWTKFVAVLAVIAGGLDFIADFVGMPEVKETIQGAMNPKYVAGFVLAVAIITIFARRRTL